MHEDIWNRKTEEIRKTEKIRKTKYEKLKDVVEYYEEKINSNDINTIKNNTIKNEILFDDDTSNIELKDILTKNILASILKGCHEKVKKSEYYRGKQENFQITDGEIIYIDDIEYFLINNLIYKINYITGNLYGNLNKSTNKVIKNTNLNKDEIIHQASLGEIILIKNNKYFIIDDLIYTINNINCKLCGNYDVINNKFKSLNIWIHLKHLIFN